jgi:hypothetical protein
MSNKHYVITSCGNRDWFTLQTEDLGMLVDILDENLCLLCKECLPENWTSYTDDEIVGLLLSTQCGANFTFSVYNSYGEMLRGEM